MLLPALNMARKKAYATTCTGNLRQNLQYCLHYIDDYKEKMKVQSYTDNLGWSTWSKRLYERGYVKNPQTLLCPALAPYKFNKDDGARYNYTYGMPRSPGEWSGYYGDAFTIPSDETRADSGCLNFSRLKGNKMLMIDSFSCERDYQKQIFDWSITGITQNVANFHHSSRANVGFSDGHVLSMSPIEARKESGNILYRYARNSKRFTF